MATITQIRIAGTLFTYIGPKPGFNPGVILYEDNGAKEIGISDVEEIITA